ncbi:MAG: PQQ-binding-like beta-propeller repeat protein [Cellvibrionaceae bacterium]
MTKVTHIPQAKFFTGYIFIGYKRKERILFSLMTLFALSSVSQLSFSEAEHAGKAVYDKACAACHNNPKETKAPDFDTLKAMRVQTISYAITEGKMQTQASGLSTQEKLALVDFLVGRNTTSDDWANAMMCPKERELDLSTPHQKASVAHFGFDNKNHRALSKEQAGLSTSDFPHLELAWTMAFPKATTMRSQAAVVGTTLFLPVADTSKVFAIDIAGEPCLQWVYTSPAPLRTSAAFGTLPNGRQVIATSDVASTVHLIDATTGEGIWTQNVAVSQFSITTGTPVIFQDKVIVPVSQYEISLGANPKHVCCKSHGAVTALDVETGEKLWTAHTMPDAKPVRDRGDGQMIWGPSGAPIWGSPAIDEKRGLIYVGTGEATSEPAHKNTDAILAIDLKDGSIKWSFQATANDIFVMGCGPTRGGPNCPKPGTTVARDVDFGAQPIIAKNSKGKDIILAGQKSGTVWALDPDDNGKVIWRKDIGEGSPLGGIHWGIAFKDNHVFAPINRPYGFRPSANIDKSIKPGMNAINIDTGEISWSYNAEPDCSGDRKERMRSCKNNIGFSGAPTIIDGAVVTGSLDGFLRAFNRSTGQLLWQFDTAQVFESINGIEAKGGSIDNASIVAANGYLFVNSGYGMFGQVPGNVMLAFKIKQKEQ